MPELLASITTTFIGDDKEFQRHLQQQKKTSKPAEHAEPADQ